MNVNHSEVFIYADDTKLIKRMNNIRDLRNLQAEVDAVATWFLEWGMILNPTKCTYLHHTPPGLGSQFDPAYNIGSHLISRGTETKDLGIIISEDLKFNKHVDHVKKKANSEIGRFNEHSNA